MLTITNAVIDNDRIHFAIPENIEAGAVIATFKYAHMADVTMQLFVSGADAKQFEFRGAHLILTGEPATDSAPTDTDLYDVHIFVRVLESGTDKALFSRVFSTQFNFEASDATQEQIAAAQAAQAPAADIDKAPISTQASRANKEKGQPASFNFETAYRILPLNTGRFAAAQTYLWVADVSTNTGLIIYVKVAALNMDIFASATPETISEARSASETAIGTEKDLPDSATQTPTPASATSYTTSTESAAIYIPQTDYVHANQKRVQTEEADAQHIPAWVTTGEQNLFEITGSFRVYEDDPAQNPAGRIRLINPEQGNYLLVVNDVVVTTDSTVIPTEYGTLEINRDGTWQYALDNSRPAVEALNGQTGEVGNILTEHVRVTYADIAGNIQEKAEIVFDITITGRTDYYGESTDDTITGRSNDETLYGLAGDDILEGGGGSDVLDGGTGLDILRGGSARTASDIEKDIFVLNLHETPDDSLAIVIDFTPGEDRIRIDTPTGTETTLEELKDSVNIYWQNENIETPSTTNDPNIEDTVIYDNRGTQDTADDIILMVLEDLIEPLTIADFDIV